MPAHFAGAAFLAACNKEESPNYTGAYKGLYRLHTHNSAHAYPTSDTLLTNATILVLPSTEAGHYSISVRELNRTVVPRIVVTGNGELTLAKGDSLSFKTVRLNAAFKKDSLNLVQEFYLGGSSHKGLMEIRARRVW